MAQAAVAQAVVVPVVVDREQVLNARAIAPSSRTVCVIVILDTLLMEQETAVRQQAEEVAQVAATEVALAMAVAMAPAAEVLQVEATEVALAVAMATEVLQVEEAVVQVPPADLVRVSKVVQVQVL